MNNRPIGVFDSGLGGLTVLKEIMKIIPNENIVYFGLPEQNEILKDFSVLSYEEAGSITSEVTMTFDKCYVPQVAEQEEYYIIHLKKYSEVYDKIVVLDEGCIVGLGTHEKLLNECTVYREIYESQFKKEGRQE